VSKKAVVKSNYFPVYIFQENVCLFKLNFFVRVFSLHFGIVTELDQLTGVAAILRFPMQELEDEVESSSDED